MHPADLASFLLAFASALLGAKLLGELSERLGQPAVLGELLAGVLLGPSVLGLVPLSAGILLIAEVGVLLLLFEVGLETDLEELLRVGGPAMTVAVVGMALPFAGGYLLTRAAGFPTLTAIFVGAALTATSIGISSRVLSDLGLLASREGQIILGAAVADDILGLVVLAVVSQIAALGSVSAWQAGKSALLSFGFLLVAIVAGLPLGRLLVRGVGRANVRGILVAVSVAFALLAALGAQAAGSAAIVGAFAAGLVLARTNRSDDIRRAVRPTVDVFAPIFFVAGLPLGRLLVRGVGRANVRGILVAVSVAFALLAALGAQAAGSAAIVGAFAAGLVLARTNRSDDIRRAVRPTVDVFAPIFFVAIGAQVDLRYLNPADPSNRPALFLALGLIAVGSLGKFAAGWAAWGRVRRSFIGAGMIPRGEVGLIFAQIGKQNGALPEPAFVAVVVAVFATTFLTPPLLKALRPRRESA